MSEHKSGQKQHHIALISDSESFHVTLLQNFLTRQFGDECLVLTTKQVPTQAKIILVDCAQADVATLNQALRTLSGSGDNCRAALLNVEQKSEYEDLLDWPCIYGIFYVDTSEEQLVRGLQRLLEGDYWVPRKLLHHFFNKHRQASGRTHAIAMPSIQLTNREKEILRMIKDGMSNSAVSETLDLSEHTVKSHLYNIYKKIGVRNRMEASNWARDQQNQDAL